MNYLLAVTCQAITKAKTYDEALNAFVIARKECKTRSGQDDLQRAIDSRPDHPMRHIPVFDDNWRPVR